MAHLFACINSISFLTIKIQAIQSLSPFVLNLSIKPNTNQQRLLNVNTLESLVRLNSHGLNAKLLGS